MRTYLVEAIGSFVLVLAFGLDRDPLARGLTLAAISYGAMHISGAHFNPAISFAYFLKKDLSFKLFVGYTISQILGCFAASGILLTITKIPFTTSSPATTPLEDQIIFEVFGCFLLVYTHLNLIGKKKSESLSINALGVGLTLTACILMGETISNAILNPAISIGSSIIHYLAVFGGSFENIPLYTVSPVAGATFAFLLYWYSNNQEETKGKVK